MAIVSQNTALVPIPTLGTSMGSTEVCYQFYLLKISRAELQSSKLKSFFMLTNL